MTSVSVSSSPVSRSTSTLTSIRTSRPFQALIGQGEKPWSRWGFVLSGAALVAASAMGIHVYNECSGYTSTRAKRAATARNILAFGVLFGLLQVFYGLAPVGAAILVPKPATPIVLQPAPATSL